jgi:hypothetical protein
MSAYGSTIVSLDGRRVTKLFDSEATVKDAFTYAAVHIAPSRYSPDEADYGAYVFGQRVAFSTRLSDVQATEVCFLRLSASALKLKSELEDKHLSSPPSILHERKRSRVSDLIEAALIKSEEDLEGTQGRPPQPRRGTDVIAISEDDAAEGSSDETAAGLASGSAQPSTAKSEDVRLPIVVGSTVQWLGPAAPEALTHRWTVYVRGVDNEDLSPVIEAVEFRLHDSFVNPARLITQPPFEVQERGWGQFTVGIRVFVRGITGPGRVTATSHFISFSPKLAAPVVAKSGVTVGNRHHCIPPFGAPYVRPSDAIPPFVHVRTPVVIERRDELVIRNAPESVRAARLQVGGRPTARAGLIVWSDVKAHLALPAGIAWTQRTTDEAKELAELGEIRDALAAEVTRTLLRAQQVQQTKPHR